MLSQNTNDLNRDVAYERLRDRFESWDEVREAPVEEVVEAIRPGGLAVTKAPRIREILRAIGDDDLWRLADEPLAQAREELCELPGVGRKTAACVLLFSFGRHDVPVDTHVHRVGVRLGLFRPEGLARGGPRRDAAALGGLRPVRVAHVAHPPWPADLPRAQPALRRVPAAADVPLRARRALSQRRVLAAEAGLVGIAAVWGLTFVMVQDAIALLPTMAFLGYRFVPAALVVAVIFRRQLRELSPAGWRAGLAMGAFLTAGYVFQTLGLEETSASNAGFITGLFVVITPVLAWAVLRDRLPTTAWIGAAVSAVGLYLLSGAGGDFTWRGDGLVLLCAVAFAGHILVTARGVRDHDVGALLVVQLGLCGVVCLAIAGLAGDLERPEGATVWSALIVTSLVASALGFFVQSYAQQHASPARTALILASEPAFAGLFGYLLADERLSAVSWVGAALILVSIVAVELVPRLRPPRPLPEA